MRRSSGLKEPRRLGRPGRPPAHLASRPSPRYRRRRLAAYATARRDGEAAAAAAAAWARWHQRAMPRRRQAWRSSGGVTPRAAAAAGSGRVCSRARIVSRIRAGPADRAECWFGPMESGWFTPECWRRSTIESIPSGADGLVCSESFLSCSLVLSKSPLLLCGSGPVSEAAPRRTPVALVEGVEAPCVAATAFRPSSRVYAGGKNARVIVAAEQPRCRATVLERNRSGLRPLVPFPCGLRHPSPITWKCA